MRYLLLLVALLQVGRTSVYAVESARDSLLSVLSQTNDPDQQIHIYRNLADLTFGTPESCQYLLTLFKKAHAVNRTRPMMEALTDLTTTYLKLEIPDSAKYSISLAKQYAPADQYDQWNCHLNMHMFASNLLNANAAQAVEEKTAEFKSRNIAGESLYQKIEAEYNLGTTLYNNDANQEAVPYLLNALKLSKELPFREGTPYQLLALRQLSRIYSIMRNLPKSVEITKSTIEVKEKYFNLYDKAERPFYPMDDFYITNYGALLINVTILPDDEAKYYLDRLIKMSDRSKNPAHKYNRFHAQFNYTAVHKDLRKALIYNDSLIYYAHRIAVYNLPDLYRINSLLNEKLGDHKNALIDLREYHRLQDSIRQQNSEVELNKMRVEYDVNRLNYEKSQLEIRNKHILVVSLTIGLALLIVLCIYLFIHLRREQVRKRQMQLLNLRADESEKLKTAFINSICHEIRTPLNCIAGYSELLFDTSIDEEERREFPDQIRRNTSELVSLIDSILQVSHLDVSSERLPCEPVDIVRLCRTVTERVSSEQYDCKLITSTDLPENQLMICTNERYLVIVIENLLTNAYKFTEQGSVSLACKHQGNDAIITITDTGCGIPLEKQQVVFNRFTKLDTYKQGSGLGLYLCKQIVQRLSGRIYIDPEYTHGTRVIVELPL